MRHNTRSFSPSRNPRTKNRLASLLRSVHWHDLAEAATRGDLDAVPTDEIMQRIGWLHMLPQGARHAAVRERLAQLGVDRAFWTEVGVPPSLLALGPPTARVGISL